MMFNLSRQLAIALFAGCALLTPMSVHADDSLGSAFTYQGQLRLNGAPVTEAAEMTFRLYDAAVDGEQVGPELHGTTVFDNEGRFTIDLTFGADVFDGSPLWLEIEVDGNTLSPRQPLMPAPYSIRALNVGAVPDASLSGTYTAPLSFTNSGNSFAGAFTGDGSGLTALSASHITSGTLGSTFLEGDYTNILNFNNVQNTFSGAFAGNGSGLLNLNATNINFGTIDPARLPIAGTWPLMSKLHIGTGMPALTIDPAQRQLGISTLQPAGQLALGNYSEIGSPVAGYTKQLVLAGEPTTSYNSGNSIKLLIAGHQNNQASDTYPIYVENMSTNVEFYLRSKFTGLQGNDPMAYFGGDVGIATETPDRRLHVVGKGGNNVNGLRITHPDAGDEGSNWDFLIGGSNNSFPGGLAIAHEGSASTGLVITKLGRVGMGTSTPTTQLEVKGPGTGHNKAVAVFENTSDHHEAGGIVVKINRTKTSALNNYITFRDADGIAGRIEGFDTIVDDIVPPPPLSIQSPSVNIPFSSGSLPTFSAGSLPSLTWDTVGILGNDVPIGLSFSSGSLPSMNPGSLPSVGTPSINWPTPSAGSWQAWVNWSYEFGLADFLNPDPVSVAMATAKVVAAEIARDGGVVYGSKGADYAEWMPKLDNDEDFRLGNVVGIHGGKVSLTTEGADQIMVVSVNPVVLGNMPEEGEEENMVKVAFMGQVPIMVRGVAQPGDYVIASGLNDGSAIAIAPDELNADDLHKVIGRAWSGSDNPHFGIIRVSVGVNTYDAARIVQRQQDRIEHLLDINEQLMDRLEAMESRLAAIEIATR